MRRLLIFCLLAATLSACGPKVVFSEEVSFPDSGWTYADSARFDFEIPNAEQAYDYVLTLDHSPDFPAQNFYVRIHTDFPSGVRRTEEVSLQLAGEFGAWNGACSGDNCQFEVPILRNARFEDTGKYGLTIEQFSRDNPLGGVSKLGFLVVESGTNG